MEWKGRRNRTLLPWWVRTALSRFASLSFLCGCDPPYDFLRGEKEDGKHRVTEDTEKRRRVWFLMFWYIFCFDVQDFNLTRMTSIMYVSSSRIKSEEVSALSHLCSVPSKIFSVSSHDLLTKCFYCPVQLLPMTTLNPNALPKFVHDDFFWMI